jgi:hypothetical protein
VSRSRLIPALVAVAAAALVVLQLPGAPGQEPVASADTALEASAVTFPGPAPMARG